MTITVLSQMSGIVLKNVINIYVTTVSGLKFSATLNVCYCKLLKFYYCNL